MALFDLHEWLVTALAAVLIAASLSLQALPTTRVAFADTAVCEKPGLATLGWVLVLH
jgi:hypothetical protein